MYIQMKPLSWSELEQHLTPLLPGGHYVPESCISDTNIALTIPYRNRDTQLRVMLKHIHPFLRNQFLKYRIFVVELVSKKICNHLYQ